MIGLLAQVDHTVKINNYHKEQNMKFNKYITATLASFGVTAPAMAHHEETLSAVVVNLSQFEIGLVIIGLATVCFTVYKSYKKKA